MMFPSILTDFYQRKEEEKEERVELLVARCGRVLVQDASLTSIAVQYLPKKLMPLLLKYALENESYPCVRMIVFNWPFHTLSVSQLNLDVSKSERQNFGQIVSTFLSRAFMDALKQRAPMVLRTLDLRGFPLNGPTLLYLSVHGILAYNEAQRKKLLQAVRETVDSGTCYIHTRLHATVATVFGDLNPDTTLPSNSYHVIIDIEISDEDANELFENVCKCLQMSSLVRDNVDVGPHLRLLINSIRMTSLIEEQNKLLLDQIAKRDGQLLTGISLKLTPLYAPITLEINRFSKLRALEVANCLSDHSLVDYLADQLPQLDHLTHLGLSGTPISNRLGSLLEACVNDLLYLDIRACRLQAIDISHLATSRHAATVQCLDISDNILGRNLTHICCLLKSARPSLRFLSIDSGKFRDDDLNRLALNCSLVPNLRFLSLVFNDWYSMDLIKRTIANYFAPHPSLELLKISLPNQLHVDFIEENQVHLHDVPMCVFLENNFQESVNTILAESIGDRKKELKVSLSPPTDTFPNGMNVIFPDFP